MTRSLDGSDNVYWYVSWEDMSLFVDEEDYGFINVRIEVTANDVVSTIEGVLFVSPGF